jgi:hypothetical protein
MFLIADCRRLVRNFTLALQVANYVPWGSEYLSELIVECIYYKLKLLPGNCHYFVIQFCGSICGPLCLHCQMEDWSGSSFTEVRLNNRASKICFPASETMVTKSLHARSTSHHNISTPDFESPHGLLHLKTQESGVEPFVECFLGDP